MCLMKDCTGGSTHRVVFTFHANLNGNTVKLSSIRGPYCDACATEIKRQADAGLPDELYESLTRAMSASGYQVMRETFMCVIAGINEAVSYAEYVPGPGMCNHPSCRSRATLKPTIIIPVKGRPIEAYLFGPGFCAIHVRSRLNIGCVDVMALRAYLLNMVNAQNLDPDIPNMRVEPRLLEWEPDAVIITRERERQKRNVQNN